MAVYIALWLFLLYHGTAELSSRSLEGLKYPALYTVDHRWLRRHEASPQQTGSLVCPHLEQTVQGTNEASELVQCGASNSYVTYKPVALNYVGNCPARFSGLGPTKSLLRF